MPRSKSCNTACYLWTRQLSGIAKQKTKKGRMTEVLNQQTTSASENPECCPFLPVTALLLRLLILSEPEPNLFLTPIQTYRYTYWVNKTNCVLYGREGRLQQKANSCLVDDFNEFNSILKDFFFNPVSIKLDLN